MHTDSLNYKRSIQSVMETFHAIESEAGKQEEKSPLMYVNVH